jgi:hypothetical protein
MRPLKEISMRTRVRLVSAIVALAAVLVAASTASAASPWTTSIKQSGTHAFAFAGDCVENGDGTVTCDNEGIDVFEGTFKEQGQPTRKGEQVCYSESTDTFDRETGAGEFSGVAGCAEDPGTVTVNNLTSVTLAATVIQLTAFEGECDAEGNCTFEETPGAGTTTVSGTWTGVGPIQSHKGRSVFDDGACLSIDSNRSSSRDASFEGSIEADEASIDQGTFTFRTNCF